MRSGRSSPRYMTGKPSWELTTWSSSVKTGSFPKPPGAVDNHGEAWFGDGRAVVQGIGGPGLRFNADAVHGLVVDHHARAVGLDHHLHEPRPAEHRRARETREAVVPRPGGRRRDHLGQRDA